MRNKGVGGNKEREELLVRDIYVPGKRMYVESCLTDYRDKN